jgi:hypothetical protein
MELKLKSSRLSVKVNLKEIVKNLFDFNIGSALTETITIDNSNESKAFLLLINTIKKTNFELSKKLGQIELNQNKDLVFKSDHFESQVINFLEKEIIITEEFFEDIIQFNPSYLVNSFMFFKQYLNLLNISIPEDLNFTYYNNFRINLESEFQENKVKYKSLIDYFDNPIINGNKKIFKQLEYYRELIKAFIEPLQPDISECKETLKDLYVEPYFEIYKNNFNSKSQDRKFEFNHLKKKITIHDFLKKYYFKDKKHPDVIETYNLLFVLGQPGQGKTSFCSKVVYDYIQESNGLPETPLYFVRIRDLVARDFIDNTFNEIKRHIKQEVNFTEDKSLLILDGLDEAYMSGGLNDGDLRNLYERLNKATQSNKELKIILTSRFNYLKLNDSCVDNSLVIQLSVLDETQIKKYIDKFKVFYPENKLVKKIIPILVNNEYKHIKELLQQAVLLYFIAISNIDVDEKDSRTVIYDKIFTSLAKRSWDKNGQLSYIKNDLKKDPVRYEKLLRKYIQNIAFAIYQSPNLYITVNQLLKLEATEEFIRKCFDDSIELSQEKIKEISKYLLISFYFQESSNNSTSETAIEFFHNSLWEYLTAEYIWEENKRILLEKDSDGDLKIISKEKYFELINKLIGQKELSYITRENLESIIENETPEENVKIASQIKSLFYKLLEDDFLLEYNRKYNLLTSFDKSVSIFELLWTFYYKSNEITNEIIYSETKLSTYLFENTYSFRMDYKLKNISFSDDHVTISYSDNCVYENITFNCFLDGSWFEDNLFNNVVFEGGLGLISMKNNKFNDVIFYNCKIDDCTYFANNHFSSCKFIDVTVPNKKWFQELIKSNKVDSLLIKNHITEEVIVKNYKNEDEIKYIIRCLNLEV